MYTIPENHFGGNESIRRHFWLFITRMSPTDVNTVHCEPKSFQTTLPVSTIWILILTLLNKKSTESIMRESLPKTHLNDESNEEQKSWRRPSLDLALSTDSSSHEESFQQTVIYSSAKTNITIHRNHHCRVFGGRWQVCHFGRRYSSHRRRNGGGQRL